MFAFLSIIEKVLCFKYYACLLYSLQFAYSLSTGEISWDCNLLVEFANDISSQSKITRSQYHNFPKTYRPQSSRYHLIQAHSLMENLAGLNNNSEFQLVSPRSKEFLRKFLEADSSESKCVTSAALAYLAAFYFASEEYKQTIQFCSTVITDQTAQEEKETLNAGCLLFIDDIARIVGLCALHKKIIDNNLLYVGRKIYLELRLSPEVFAHYLGLSILSTESRSTNLGFGRDLYDSSFPMDNNVKALIMPKCRLLLK